MGIWDLFICLFIVLQLLFAYIFVNMDTDLFLYVSMSNHCVYFPDRNKGEGKCY